MGGIDGAVEVTGVNDCVWARKEELLKDVGWVDVEAVVWGTVNWFDGVE